MRSFKRPIVSLLTATALVALAGCAAEDADDGSSDDALTGARCPTTKAAEIRALGDVAAQAARCATDTTAPAFSPRGFAHTRNHASSLLPAQHRGRDAFYPVGNDQWVLGKFAYGLSDKDIKGEEVDVFVQRGCAGAWEKLGTATTTQDGEHETVEGVEDKGGRVYFRIPAAKALPIGHHRVRMVVAGDGTWADQHIEVLPRGAAIFVSDVDGTLTERRPGDPAVVCDEESDFPALWRGMMGGAGQPYVHEHVAATFDKLAALGYRPMYLTARPEPLAPHTRAFLRASARGDGRGDLPLGVVHTTLGLTGAINSAAEDFKKSELEMLSKKGFRPTFGFGNRKSDVATYEAYRVPYGFLYENPDTAVRACSQVATLPRAGSRLTAGMRRVQSYGEALGLVATTGPVCR